MRIAILTRKDFSSPRILAETLELELINRNISVKVFYGLDILTRLVDFKESRLSFQFWLRRKLAYWYKDWKAFKNLQKFDAIIITEAIPNGFQKHKYNVKKFKSILNKPIIHYAVHYIGNAPTQIKELVKQNELILDRYDFHFSVSAVTEIKCAPTLNWFPIGIVSKYWDLKPKPKTDFFAIVDFEQPGHKLYRNIQMQALERAGIPYISFDKKYSFDEIRNVYQEAALLFVESPESFGVPILECLCCGNQIFTPNSAWPMAWRLNDNPKEYEPGDLAECFTIYSDEDDLVMKLLEFKNSYDYEYTPKKIFNIFRNAYPSFYEGNISLSDALLAIENLKDKYPK